MKGDHWLTRAACGPEDAEKFAHAEQWNEAADLCRSCPVLNECLAANLRMPYGYVGGTTPNERRAAVRYGTKPEDVRHSWSPGPVDSHDRDQVIAQYRGGLGVRKVAEQMGMSRDAVTKVLAQAGVKRPPPVRKGQPGYDELLKSIRKMHRDGAAPRQIATALSCSISTVYRESDRTSSNDRE